MLDQRLLDLAKALNVNVVIKNIPDHNGIYQSHQHTILINDNVIGNTADQVLAHELIHATGHPRFLKRLSIYIQPTEKKLNEEETTAEIGSIWLLDFFKIPYDKENCEYYIKDYSRNIDQLTKYKAETNAKLAADFLIAIHLKLDKLAA